MQCEVWGHSAGWRRVSSNKSSSLPPAPVVTGKTEVGVCVCGGGGGGGAWGVGGEGGEGGINTAAAKCTEI